MDDALGGENSLSLLSLRRAGVRFDDRVTSFADLIQQQQQSAKNDEDDGPSSPSTSLVSLCRECFVQFGHEKLAKRLPNALGRASDPSGRFRVATSYARALNGVVFNKNANNGSSTRNGGDGDGGDGDGGGKRRIGFSHFLYPSEEYAREIVALLCEMIPEEERGKSNATSSTLFGRGEDGSVDSALERAVRVANGVKTSSSLGEAASPFESSLRRSDRKRRMREIVNAQARVVANRQRMRDREGFALTKNKEVAWTKENGLWPEGPEDDDGIAVNVLASNGVGGLVAAALRVAGGDKLASNSSKNSRNAGNDGGEEEMQRLGDRIKSAAEAKKNREDSANETLEQRAQAREKDLEDLQNDVETTRQTMEAYVSRCEKALEEMLEYARLEKEERAKFPDLEEEYLIRKMATDMVVGPNASKGSPEKAKEEMEKLVREDENRRQELQKEWDDARLPLEYEIEKRNAKAEAERMRAKEQLEEIQRWKEEAKEQVQLARQKAEERDRLSQALERAPRGVNRPSLVQKVTTIVKNIKKQDVEIAKIVRDAKAAELQVAESAESLRRIYAVVEDAIFKSAKTDETMKLAYRYLHDMHKTFAKISRDVAEASESARARGELEEQMDSLKELKTDSKHVAKDVAMLRKSVKKLEERVNVK